MSVVGRIQGHLCALICSKYDVLLEIRWSEQDGEGAPWGREHSKDKRGGALPTEG